MTTLGLLRSKSSSSSAVTSRTSGLFSGGELIFNEKGAPYRAPLGRLQGLGSRCPGRGL